MSASPFQMQTNDLSGAASPASNVVTSTCFSCYGCGLKYQHDYYGNPTSVLCTTCSGRGVVAYEVPASPQPAPATYVCSGCSGSGIQHQSNSIQCLVPYGQYCHFCALCVQCGGQGLVKY